MAPYFALFAFFAIAALVSGGRSEEPRRASLWAAAALLIVLIGFRWEVGADWRTYASILNFIRMADFSHAIVRTEPAYAFTNWVAVQAGWDIWFPNLVCAAIFTSGLVAFSRQQPNAWLALLVAVPYCIIGVAMGFTRQSAALGFIMLALVEFSRGSPAKTALYVGFATAFHVSAIVVAPLIALASIRRGVVAFIVILVTASMLYYQFSERLLGRAELYSSHSYAAGGALPRILMNLLAALIFLSFKSRFARTYEEKRLWTLFSLASVGMLPFLYYVNSTTVADRLGIYLIPLQILVMSRLPMAFGKSRRQNLLFLSAIIAYSLVYEVAWLTFGTWSQAWVPYQNYLWDQFVTSNVQRT